MFRTIVVGCDGSEHTADALALAQQLRHRDGRLLLTTVHDHFGALPDRRGGYHYAEYVAQQAERDLDAAAARLPADVPFERHVVADDSVAKAIDGLALREQADLIVLGPTHRGTAARLTGRATIQRLLHGAPCAVAVAVPGQRERLGERPRLGVAHDGSPESDLAAQTAYEIAAETFGSVLLLRVIEPIVYTAGYAPVPNDLDAEDELRTHAGSRLAEVAKRAPDGITVERRLLHGATVRKILDVAVESCDLLVVGSRRYGPLRRVLVGSVSTHLLTDGQVPVLVTPRVASESVAEPSDEAGTVQAVS